MVVEVTAVEIEVEEPENVEIRAAAVIADPTADPTAAATAAATRAGSQTWKKQTKDMN